MRIEAYINPISNVIVIIEWMLIDKSSYQVLRNSVLCGITYILLNTQAHKHTRALFYH